MTILHYIPSIDRSWGGVSTYMQLLSEGLGQLVDLHIVTHHSENELDIPYSKIHYIPRNWIFPRCNKTKKQFIDILNQVKPDIVHSNGCWEPICAYSVIWAKEQGYPVVLSPHGMLEPWILNRHYWTKKVPALFLYQKEAIRKADLLHTTADSEQHNIIKLGWNVHTTIIGNCVDVKSITIKNDWKRKKNILFLSRVHPKKGIDFLIEAVSEIKDKLAGYKVLIAGESFMDYIDTLKTLAEKKHVSDYIEFMGGVYGDDKWDLYKKADLFVLPTHSENFGIVVAEALATGVPVITTKGTPWKELLEYNCGWYIDIGKKPLVEALKQFTELSDNELVTMGLNGRKLIERKFSCETIASQFVEMYKSLLHGI